MSNWDSQPPYRGFDDVYQPYGEPRRTGGNRRLVLAVVALVGLGFFVVVVCAVVMVRKMRDDAEREWVIDETALLEPALDEPAWQETFEQKNAAVVAAFSSDSLGISTAQLKPVERLFDAVVATMAEDDDEAFAEFVDVPRFLNEMRASGVMSPSSPRDTALQINWVRQDMYAPVCAATYKIVHVQRQPEQAAAVVYAYLWTADGDEYKSRWWITRESGQWKVYDWELLDFGLRASIVDALCFEHGGDFRLQRYFDFGVQREKADALADDDRPDEAAELIRRGENYRVLPELHDAHWARVGFGWVYGSHFREALACFDRVAIPEATPGAIFGQLYCYHARGQHAKAIEAAKRYEAASGCDATGSALAADSLLELGRAAEAVVECRKTLDVDPDRLDTLQALGHALAGEEKEILVQYVAQTADPVDTAEGLIEHFSLYDDVAAIDVLGDFLAEHDPDPSRVAYLAALAAEAEGDYAAAAAKYREAAAATDDDETKQSYAGQAVYASLSAGQPVEGYLAAANPREAFRDLAEGYLDGEYDFDAETFSKLLEAHRRRFPDDPWLGFYTGALLVEQEKHEEAAAEFAALAESDDEEVRDAASYWHLEAMANTGKVMEAYEQIGQPAETFRSLARLLKWDDSPQKTELLETLVAAHRKAAADDPWLDYYEALVHSRRKEYARADQLLARGQRNTDDEDLQGEYHRKRLATRIEAGDLDGVLDEISPREETFIYLARQLFYAEKWPEFDVLVAQLSAHDHAEGYPAPWLAKMYSQREQYASVVALLDEWPEELAAELDEWDVKQMRDLHVRSLLRLAQAADESGAARANYLARALDVAESIYEEYANPLPLVLVHAARGDVPQVRQHLVELQPWSYRVTSLYNDEAVGRVLRSDEFLDVRRECPPGLPFLSGDSVVLLLAEAAPSDAESLKIRLRPFLGADGTVTALPRGDEPDAPASFLLSKNDQAYVVSFGSDRYTGGEVNVEDAALKQVLADHQAWLSITALATNDADREATSDTVLILATVFLDDRCLAFYSDDRGRLIPAGPALDEMLRALAQDEEDEETGEELWLYRGADADDQRWEALKKRRQALCEFVSASAEPTFGDRLSVKIELQVAEASEPHWLSIRRVLRGRYGSVTFVGEFTDDSVLVPHFRRGEPLCIREHNVVEWKVDEPDGGR